MSQDFGRRSTREPETATTKTKKTKIGRNPEPDDDDDDDDDDDGGGGDDDAPDHAHDADDDDDPPPRLPRGRVWACYRYDDVVTLVM